jgi:Skp family chaperone for outer membrane proteins
MADLLLIDLPALLDTSRVGLDAAKALEKTWNDSKKESEPRRKELLAQLQQRRDALRTALLQRAKPIIAAHAKKKSAKVVLEKGTAVWTDPTVEDITASVIKEVDAGGPLKV